MTILATVAIVATVAAVGIQVPLAVVAMEDCATDKGTGNRHRRCCLVDPGGQRRRINIIIVVAVKQ